MWNSKQKMHLKQLTVIFYFFLQFSNVLSGSVEGTSCILKDGTDGICKKISKCPFVKKDLKRLSFPRLCSYNILKPVVCCIKCTETEEATRTMTVRYDPNFLIPGYGKANDRCLEEYYQRMPCNQLDEYYRNLDKSIICYEKPTGLSATYLFAGNREAQKTQFPHMALIGYGDDPDTADWMCGGSVISDRYILTAAHCISSPYLGEIRYAGLGVLKRTDPTYYWQIYDITKLIAHPEYRPPSKYHDIALLETGAKIRYNKDVLPACLYRESDLPSEAIATVWGALGHRKPMAGLLQAVTVERYSDEMCYVKYPRHRHLLKGYNSTTQTCYGHEELDHDTCEGDSGGPLQVMASGRQASKCLYTIVGVTSYGRSCGYHGSTGMYTKVAHYVPWIERITGKLK